MQCEICEEKKDNHLLIPFLGGWVHTYCILKTKIMTEGTTKNPATFFWGAASK